MFALEEVGGAAEVTAVGTAQAAEDFAGAGNAPAEHLQPADDQRMFIGHRDDGLAKQFAEVGHAFAAADVIRPGLEDIILQDGAVTAQNNLALRRVFADQGDGLLHFVDERHDEGDADIVVALLKLLDQFAPGRVLQHHGRGVEILRDVIESELDVDGAGTEDSLRTCHLTVKQFVADRRGVALLGADWTADTGQQYFLALGFGHKVVACWKRAQRLGMK